MKKFSLVINYLGQAAWVMHQSSHTLNGRNPFYEIMPSWFLILGIIIATAATIIASQALISGSYTLINEAMNLNFWPRIQVKQPSESKGQIYIPSVNTILWIGCIMMIVYFRSSTHMEAAYGFSITITMMMTTYLLSYFLRYRLKWHWILVTFILIVFFTVETSFFIANVAKIKERWMFLFFELFIFMTMYVWYFARKEKNKLIKFIQINDYVPMLQALSADDEISKFSTHLIYLTKADRKSEIEEKIVKSIFAKKPKRADVYWFVHLERTEDPYTLSYSVSEIVDDTIIKINIKIGFRIVPKTEMYFKKIVQDLVANKELNLHIRADGSTKYNTEPEFKFVVIERFLSIENEFTIRQGVMLNSYFMLKKLGQKDEAAFGLEKSDVVVEEVPLIFEKTTHFNLKREL